MQYTLSCQKCPFYKKTNYLILINELPCTVSTEWLTNGVGSIIYISSLLGYLFGGSVVKVIEPNCTVGCER